MKGSARFKIQEFGKEGKGNSNVLFNRESKVCHFQNARESVLSWFDLDVFNSAI
jgi:hypothetical protein